jgi:hypothetical protein
MPAAGCRERPVRVLHVIDGLVGGGAERWVWEIVRHSDPGRVQHRVVTIIPDCSAFVYAAPLRELGAYGGPSTSTPPSRPGSKRAGASVMDRLTLAVRTRWPLNTSRRTALAGFLLAPTAFARLFREYRSFQPDVIHGHIFYGTAYALALRRLSGRPMVCSVTAHLRQMVDAGYGWVPHLFRRFHPLVDQFYTDAGYHEELLELGVPSERVRCYRGTLDLAPVVAAMRQRERHRRAWFLGFLWCVGSSSEMACRAGCSQPARSSWAWKTTSALRGSIRTSIHTLPRPICSCGPTCWRERTSPAR